MRRSEVYDDRVASRAIAVHTARRAARSGALWGLVFGGTVAATMSTYTSTFPTPESRANIAASVQGNAAFEAIFGITHHLDTVAGYTAYKTMFTLILLGSIWGLLFATRALRGDEDNGRWEVFLSGQTTRGHAAAQVAIGLGVGVVALWIPTVLFAVTTGASSDVNIGVGTCVFFATAMVAPAAMFMAVGMLVSQLAASRHEANLLGAGVLAASYLIRMAADSDSRLGWLRWATPFGWVEEARGLTGSNVVAFVPMALLVTVLVFASMRIAAQRDLGASAFAVRDSPEPRTLLLGGQAGLTVRLTRPLVVGWLVALGFTGLVFGLVTQAAGRSLRGSPTLDRVISRLGATDAGAVAYLGFVFIIAAGLVAIAVAGQVAALRNEEASGHLDNLLVRPVARWRWLTVRLLVGVGLVITASALTGVAAWVGAASQHASVGFGDLLEAGLNVAPPGLFVLGIGALAFGLVPRAAVGVTYGLVVWSFLVETVASIVDSNQFLLDTSPFRHLAPAPAADPNWGAAAWLVALGIIAAVAGIAAFARRDMTGA
jgi:ABC-2 type transport system permease protein